MGGWTEAQSEGSRDSASHTKSPAPGERRATHPGADPTWGARGGGGVPHTRCGPRCPGSRSGGAEGARPRPTPPPRSPERRHQLVQRPATDTEWLRDEDKKRAQGPRKDKFGGSKKEEKYLEEEGREKVSGAAAGAGWTLTQLSREQAPRQAPMAEPGAGRQPRIPDPGRLQALGWPHPEPRPALAPPHLTKSLDTFRPRSEAS